jgi:hypothetical protein
VRLGDGHVRIGGRVAAHVPEREIAKALRRPAEVAVNGLFPFEAAREPERRRVGKLHDGVVGEEVNPALNVVTDELEVLVEGSSGVARRVGRRHVLSSSRGILEGSEADFAARPDR